MKGPIICGGLLSGRIIDLMEPAGDACERFVLQGFLGLLFFSRLVAPLDLSLRGGL